MENNHHNQPPHKLIENAILMSGLDDEGKIVTGANVMHSNESLQLICFGQICESHRKEVYDVTSRIKQKFNEHLTLEDIESKTGDYRIMCTIQNRDVRHSGNTHTHGWVLHDPDDRKPVVRDINGVACHVNETIRYCEKTIKDLARFKKCAYVSEGSGALPKGYTANLPSLQNQVVSIGDHTEVDIELIKELKKLSYEKLCVKLAATKIAINGATKDAINKLIEEKKEAAIQKIQSGFGGFEHVA